MKLSEIRNFEGKVVFGMTWDGHKFAAKLVQAKRNMAVFETRKGELIYNPLDEIAFLKVVRFTSSGEVV